MGLPVPETKLVSLVPGQYFGEKALLSQDTRQATCVAGVETDGCRCLALNRMDFVNILGPLSDLLEGRTVGDS